MRDYPCFVMGVASLATPWIYIPLSSLLIPRNYRKSYEPSKTVAATKKFGHTSQPIIPSNPDSDATKADIDAESSIVVPLAAAAQPPVVLAADTTDAFTIEDADDATAAAAEGATLPTTPNGSSVTMHANRNATISWSKAQRPII
ncbi:hypothetical protein V6N11_058427 [Hibiscus sabdariffa]|uniref:Uncharacterized protein n=1 Tax=Hibiscus sabdariffa TaxID=183260 RepID=A0ABR2U4Z7_9ROSI